MVTGLLGKKLGMARIFTEEGRQIAVTLLEAGPCAVVQRKMQETDGYDAVQLGFGEKKANRVTKPAAGHFKKAGVAAARTLREFKVDGPSELTAGDAVNADLFAVGDRVDISGITKGKGFQGVIKRHGMSGGPGGHGSMFHRAPGSIGQSADPSKVFKNVRLPGHMGSRRVTTQNLEVVRVDTENNLIAVRGSVPGAPGTLIIVKKSVKHAAKGAK
jgi:large subunit ribosomal protein L3